MEQRGRVTYWNEDRGFGFVRIDGTADDVFLHAKVLRIGEKPREGDRMRLTVADSPRGPSATAASKEDAR